MEEGVDSTNGWKSKGGRDEMKDEGRNGGKLEGW